MSLDTASRRSSAVFVWSPWRTALPLPDGTISAQDRAMTARACAGITAAEPMAAAGRGGFIVNMGRLMGR